jgi:[acyl-carrier-protein] S-malonyltransferase
MTTAVEMGCTVFLELGPGRGLARMISTRFPDVQARSVEEFRSLSAVARWVGRFL